MTYLTCGRCCLFFIISSIAIASADVLFVVANRKKWAKNQLVNRWKANRTNMVEKINSLKYINFNCCLHCHSHSEQMIHWLPMTIVAFTLQTNFDFVHILIITVENQCVFKVFPSHFLPLFSPSISCFFFCLHFDEP